MTQNLKSVVVYGNDLHSLSAALLIADAFSGIDLTIDLVMPGSPSHASSVSLFSIDDNVLKAFGETEKSLLLKCKGAYTLGTQYKNLPGLPKSHFQSFGGHGGPMDMVAFQHFYFKKKTQNAVCNYDDYSLNCQMAKQNRFVLAPKDPRSILATMQYGINLHAKSFYSLLLEKCKAKKVNIITQNIVNYSSASDNKIAVLLDEQQSINADLLIDCVGIGPEITERSNSRSSANNFDRIASLEVERNKSIEVFNRLSFDKNTCLKKTALKSSDVYELSYNSQEFSEDQIYRMFVEQIDELGASKTPEKYLSKMEVREKQFTWQKESFIKNYVRLGEAAYCFEETEVSNLHFTFCNLNALLALLPHHNEQISVNNYEFNRKYALRMQNVMDYLLIKFVNSESHQAVLASVPSFQQKLDYFSSTGSIAYFEEEVFHEPYRLSAFIGTSISPQSFDYLIERFDFDLLDERFDGMKNIIQSTVSELANAQEFLEELYSE